ncbi:MAG: Sua5/YciO/YrdC/YwlC family protein [Mariprofundaceae bacterium]|nr:Sua5/YciO/YrdC/YwlC family protein [Mariprofundaceae bacterium]
MPHRLRQFSLKIKRKLAALRARKVLLQGGLLAHKTATIAGVSANPESLAGVKKMQRFKQRSGPFLLLADSISTALAQARYISPVLRKLARDSWPGAVTLVFPSKPQYQAACYQRGSMAIRVDVDSESQYLAHLCGGLLLSSSLNRRGKTTMLLNRRLHWRFSACIDAKLLSQTSDASNQPSKIYRISSLSVKQLR